MFSVEDVFTYFHGENQQDREQKERKKERKKEKERAREREAKGRETERCMEIMELLFSLTMQYTHTTLLTELIVI